MPGKYTYKFAIQGTLSESYIAGVNEHGSIVLCTAHQLEQGTNRPIVFWSRGMAMLYLNSLVKANPHMKGGWHVVPIKVPTYKEHSGSPMIGGTFPQ
jgi:hypothetical protein